MIAYTSCVDLSAATAAYCCRIVARARLENLKCSRLRLSVERARMHNISIVWIYSRIALISRLPEAESISVWGASRELLTTNEGG
jgi:hypothetical protein